MDVQLPRWIRVAMYLATLFTAPFIIYFNTTGVIGEAEVNLFAGLGAVASLVAGFHVPGVNKNVK